MAKNQPLRKNPRMPSKAPRVPKSPVGFSHKQKVSPEKPFSCVCVGGPYAGQFLSMLRSSPNTAIFKAGGQSGRYTLEEQFENERCIARWEAA